MKQLAIVLAVTAIFLVFGCEKRAGQSKEADRYDADTDGPPCVLTVSADENLLADQKKISRQAELSAVPAESEEKDTSEDTGGEDATPAPTTSPATSPLPANRELNGISCEKFDVSVTIKGESLQLTLETDLPDYTDLMVSVHRTYTEKGKSENYFVDYFSKKSTVGIWKGTHTIPVKHDEWIQKFETKRKKLAKIGMAEKIGSISDNIEVSLVVPVNQSNTAFGEMNKNLRGKMVRVDGQLRIVKWEKKILYPLKGSPSALRWADPRGLRVGSLYRLSKRTPFMPEFEPADPLTAISKMKYIPPKGRIRVTAVRKKRNTPWYAVRASDADGNALGNGWVNSIALLGQEIKIVNSSTER